LELGIFDMGEGIAPCFLPHVFERLRRSDASTRRRHFDLGLGLNIVKELAENPGGSVRFAFLQASIRLHDAYESAER
jgi:signal transduction histidine kinase